MGLIVPLRQCDKLKPAFPTKLAGCVLLALATGCGRDQIQEYRVAKDTNPPPAEPQAQSQPPAAMPPMAAAGAAAGTPTVQWAKPEGWEEVPPGEMRLASFRVAGKGGKQADVSVVPLGGLGGGDLDNVNRWRGQVGLPRIEAGELPQLTQPVEIGGQNGQLYDLAGTNPGSGDKVRMLVAVLRREGTAWFFKMTGDDELVAQQKPAFVSFLKSLTFGGGGPAMASPAASELPPSHPPIPSQGTAPFAAGTGGAGPAKPDWQVPSGWQEVAGGQFLVAKFTLSGPASAQAAVNVSSSVGDGGGLLANVNRWRGQLGLAPMADADLQQQAKALETTAGKAAVVEMAGTDGRTGQPARLVGVMVPQGGRTWFYKLMGDGQVVEREKDAFTKFVQSVKYPDAS
jgi:hypothetical protein